MSQIKSITSSPISVDFCNQVLPFKLRGVAVQSKNCSIHELRELVKNACRLNPHLTTRLEKAAFLVVLRPILPLGRRHYQVGSEDGLRSYEVINGHCNCSDYVRHGPRHPCKHRIALALYLKTEGKLSHYASEDLQPIDGVVLDSDTS